MCSTLKTLVCDDSGGLVPGAVDEHHSLDRTAACVRVCLAHFYPLHPRLSVGREMLPQLLQRHGVRSGKHQQDLRREGCVSRAGLSSRWFCRGLAHVFRAVVQLRDAGVGVDGDVLRSQQLGLHRRALPVRLVGVLDDVDLHRQLEQQSGVLTTAELFSTHMYSPQEMTAVCD